MNYFCAGCQRKLEAHQTILFHSLGRMCLLCRSGRVAPLREQK